MNIGKSKYPNAFRKEKIDLNMFPVLWNLNKKVWMTIEVFTAWLNKLNDEMKQVNRKILLFLDNATSHPHVDLSNIEQFFLPSNTTTHLQPLDQGIIQTIKLIFRKSVLKECLSNIDSFDSISSFGKSITVLDAIMKLSYAWEFVKSSIIVRCFANAVFSMIQVENAQINDQAEQFFNLADSILQNPLFESKNVIVSEFVQIDDDIDSHEIILGETHEDTFQRVLREHQ